MTPTIAGAKRDSRKEGDTMKLHPYAVALVARLLAEGKAGKFPFGVPLAIWEQEIAKVKSAS